MQTKSEMINRIAELAEENAELNAIIDSYQPRLQALKVEIAELQAYKDVNEDFKTAWEELKAENERLKEEVETRDNLVEHFRKEAINWAKIANDCIKDIENYKQTLQEIKEIAENAYCLTNYTNKDMANFAKQILQLITKAEEE